MSNDLKLGQLSILQELQLSLIHIFSDADSEFEADCDSETDALSDADSELDTDCDSDTEALSEADSELDTDCDSLTDALTDADSCLLYTSRCV